MTRAIRGLDRDAPSTRSSPAVIEPRPYCLACRRARNMCACAALRPFTIGFGLALLMHPKEAKVAIGTGRLTHRAVTGSHLFVGDRLDDDPRLATLLAADVAPAILFPRPDALDLDRATPSEAAALFGGRRPLVLVVDGTWTTAKSLLRLAPRLASLPALRFLPTRPSRYGRLRKEPRADCWSTLESVHHLIDRFDALGLAPAPGRTHDHLLAMMEDLVHRQLAFDQGPRATRGGRQRPEA